MEVEEDLRFPRMQFLRSDVFSPGTHCSSTRVWLFDAAVRKGACDGPPDLARRHVGRENTCRLVGRRPVGAAGRYRHRGRGGGMVADSGRGREGDADLVALMPVLGEATG